MLKVSRTFRYFVLDIEDFSKSHFLLYNVHIKFLVSEIYPMSVFVPL